jgi:hypothetical protein
MSDRTERPLPLDMDRQDVRRALDFLDKQGDPEEVSERLLIEILDCLRRIDDKLGKLLAKPPH